MPASLPFRPLPLCLLLAGLCLLAALWALATGPVAVPLPRVVGSLLPWLGAVPDPMEAAVITQIRLPRVAMALLVGGGLAAAGAAMQGVFRNPLADPGLVGVSSGAALAAVAVIVMGAQWLGRLPPAWALPLAAFGGGLLATWVVLRMAMVDGYTRVATLLLAGLAVNAVAGAGIGLLAHVADDVALRSLIFWMFGSLGKSGWTEIAVAAPLLLAAVLLIPRDARALNALLLGEAEAGHLGVNVERLKRRLILLAVLAVGAAVSLAGIIGFVGLVVPHLIRVWAGPDHRLLLPAATLLGALLLTLADIAARTVMAPAELPIGILTALVGGPFFLLLLMRYRAAPETL